jgi:hypothetical protein
MQSPIQQTRKAEVEVHRTAHDQDLVEVPKRARLDREADAKTLSREFPVIDNQ